MKKIVLLCHGEGLWSQENRFTGWTDVDLSEKSVVEACKVGSTLRETGFSSEIVCTFYLKCTIRTLDYVLDRLNESWIPVKKIQRPNGKHYGILQGLNKSETAAQYGEEQVYTWRKGHDIASTALGRDDSHNPGKDIHCVDVPDMEPPYAESLKDAIECVMPYWKCIILSTLTCKDNLLVTAHGNSLRGIIRHFKETSDTDISSLNLPTAVPYISEFDNRLVPVKDYLLGGLEEIRKRTEAVARQGMIKQ